jgi:hypothetical protein
MSLVVDRSVEAVRVDHFEQLVVVAIVAVYADEYWTIAVKEFVHSTQETMPVAITSPGSNSTYQ